MIDTCPDKVCCQPSMFDTYGLNIYPVLTNPEVRVDFTCPPGWNCKKATDTVIIVEGHNWTHCDYPSECGFGLTPPNAPGGHPPTNLCDLIGFTAQQAITRGLQDMGPRVRVGNDVQTATCADFGFPAGSDTVTIAPNTVYESAAAIQLGEGSMSQVRQIVCGIPGPVQVTYQHPAWSVKREEAKEKANAKAKDMAKKAYLDKVSDGTFPNCDTAWVLTGDCGNATGTPPTGILCYGDIGQLNPVGCIFTSPLPESLCGNPPFVAYGFNVAKTYGPYTRRKRVRLTGSITDTCRSYTCPVFLPPFNTLIRYDGHLLTVNCGAQQISVNVGGGTELAPINPISVTVPIDLVAVLETGQTAVVSVMRGFGGGTLTGSFTVKVEDA